VKQAPANRGFSVKIAEKHLFGEEQIKDKNSI